VGTGKLRGTTVDGGSTVVPPSPYPLTTTPSNCAYLESSLPHSSHSAPVLSAPTFSSLSDATEVKAAESLCVPNVDMPPVVHSSMPNTTVIDVYLVDDSGKPIRA